MKIILITRLDLINFKGIRNLHVDFPGGSAFIYGANGIGKTSVFDAFSWLLFGKDSSGRADFNVKTLDENQVVIPKLEHEVQADIIVDGQPINLRRILKENWQKKKGSTIPEFTGNTTEYYWDGVPMQAKEYQKNISALMEESLFKLLTNTLAFNSLPWQERRSILSRMVSVTDAEIAAGNTAFTQLLEQIKGQKSMEEFKKMKLASVAKAKEQIKTIPTRIDEVSRMAPKPDDFAVIREELDEKDIQVKFIDDQIQDSTKEVDEIIRKRNEHALAVNNIKSAIAKIESTVTNEANKQLNDSKADFNLKQHQLTSAQSELVTAKNSVDVLNKGIESKQSQIQQKEKLILEKRQEWAAENSKELTLDPNSLCCPACKRELEAADMEAKQNELNTNFQTAKANKLAEIQKQGKQLGDEKRYLETELATTNKMLQTNISRVLELEEKIKGLTTELDKLKTQPGEDDKKFEGIYESILSMNPEYKTKKEELAEMEKIAFEVPTVNNDHLKTQRADIIALAEILKTRLAAEAQIKKIEERVKALSEEEADLAQQIADVEKIVADIDAFTKAKIDAIEERVNAKFSLVKFKMFEKQINGGETECCEATVNGVPFSDLNTASRINAGVDIINTLSEFFGVSVPIWVDNRESITEVLETKCQLINLVVSPKDLELRVA